MKVRCIRDNDSGYVPVTSYKKGDIVEANRNSDKYFDRNTKSELNMKHFICITEHRDKIIDDILNNE